MPPRSPKLTIVANRLPMTADDNGILRPSPGGLASALASLSAHAPMRWIGAAPATADEIFVDDGVIGIGLDDLDREGHHRFSNCLLWPALHGLAGDPTEQVEPWWRVAYDRVNESFALGIAAQAPECSTVWIHDYHLLLVPSRLAQLRPDLHIGYFLHTPFHSVDRFRRLPGSAALLDGLRGAQLIGVQTDDDAARLREAMRRMTWAEAGPIPEPAVVEAFPISVDARTIDSAGADPVVGREAARLRAALGDPEFVLLGVDRLDYTKGIPTRLDALRSTLESGDLPGSGDAVFVQVSVPSREDLGAYAQERAAVEERVDSLNADFGSPGHPMVVHLERSFGQLDLLSLYRAADVLVVSSVCDGMNLVAKEYVAARGDDGGALVLSRGAGASHELEDAFLVEPRTTSVAAGMVAAVHADDTERRRRMSSLREQVMGHDVDRWSSSFLDRLALLGSSAGPIATSGRAA